MTNKKEMNLEEMEKVNGGFLLTLVGGLIVKTIIDNSKKNNAPAPAPAAPTSKDNSVTNNKAGGNQNINSGEFTQNKNSRFGG